jgi:hypothetical protein
MNIVDFLLLASVIISAPHISKDRAQVFALLLWTAGGLLALLKWATA